MKEFQAKMQKKIALKFLNWRKL